MSGIGWTSGRLVGGELTTAEEKGVLIALTAMILDSKFRKPLGKKQL